jgi:GxxExxY protein
MLIQNQMETNFIVLDGATPNYTSNPNYPHQDEVYKIIGACMEVHSVLGRGFLEIVYKDALEYEFQLRGIPYEREKKLEIFYKDIKIKRDFFADFFVFNEIILEAKAQAGVVDELYKQTINYLAATRKELGVLVNFGEDSLVYKRVIHTPKRTY